jgi:hypothetical protein
MDERAIKRCLNGGCATMLAGTVPELPCTVLLTTEERQALSCHANGVAQPAQATPSLGQAVLYPRVKYAA